MIGSCTPTYENGEPGDRGRHRRDWWTVEPEILENQNASQNAPKSHEMLKLVHTRPSCQEKYSLRKYVPWREMLCAENEMWRGWISTTQTGKRSTVSTSNIILGHVTNHLPPKARWGTVSSLCNSTIFPSSYADVSGPTNKDPFFVCPPLSDSSPSRMTQVEWPKSESNDPSPLPIFVSGNSLATLFSFIADPSRPAQPPLVRRSTIPLVFQRAAPAESLCQGIRAASRPPAQEAGRACAAGSAREPRAVPLPWGNISIGAQRTSACSGLGRGPRGVNPAEFMPKVGF